MNAIVQASEAVLTKKALADSRARPGRSTAPPAAVRGDAAGRLCTCDQRATAARAPPRFLLLLGGERSGGSALFPLLFSPPPSSCPHVATGFGDQLARAPSRHKPGMPVVCFAGAPGRPPAQLCRALHPSSGSRRSSRVRAAGRDARAAAAARARAPPRARRVSGENSASLRFSPSLLPFPFPPSLSGREPRRRGGPDRARARLLRAGHTVMILGPSGRRRRRRETLDAHGRRRERGAGGAARAAASPPPHTPPLNPPPPSAGRRAGGEPARRAGGRRPNGAGAGAWCTRRRLLLRNPGPARPLGVSITSLGQCGSRPPSDRLARGAKG